MLYKGDSRCKFESTGFPYQIIKEINENEHHIINQSNGIWIFGKSHRVVVNKCTSGVN